MSTFNGIVPEFPDIRIDFFRRHANVQPPLACFLSHVHSDHLAGLESLRSPFVYCSAATKEILLKLERYPCRINNAKGILEARQQTYKHLAKMLKPLPLETPTSLELCPGHHIQVTLFDANHCLGAVMFLIEGDGKAILYTGDIRSEPWFVNTIARSPSLVEYTSGIKTLDKLYLDTSFTRDIPFQTKAEGIAELLRKVKQYPSNTVFHFQAWTYGYEDVWVALSKTLKSPIHVDDYKLRVYSSLKTRSPDNRFGADFHHTPESPALTGYMCGNSPHPGCLTSDINVRLHSCEIGNMCEVARRPSTVKIQPIVAHIRGGDLEELGIGGGGEDLEREAELDSLDPTAFTDLINMIFASEELTNDQRRSIQRIFTFTASTGRNIPTDLNMSSGDRSYTTNDAIHSILQKLRLREEDPGTHDDIPRNELPSVIRFPYSRHSSYPELCHLVQTFRPKDVWPCTVNPTEWLNEEISIRSLFGHLCAGITFEHDDLMQKCASRHRDKLERCYTESQTTSDSSPLASPSKEISSYICDIDMRTSTASQTYSDMIGDDDSPMIILQPRDTMMNSIEVPDHIATDSMGRASSHKRNYASISGGVEHLPNHVNKPSQRRRPSSSSSSGSPARYDAYRQMLLNARSDMWEPINLISTSGHGSSDQEL